MAFFLHGEIEPQIYWYCQLYFEVSAMQHGLEGGERWDQFESIVHIND